MVLGLVLGAGSRLVWGWFWGVQGWLRVALKLVYGLMMAHQQEPLAIWASRVLYLETIRHKCHTCILVTSVRQSAKDLGQSDELVQCAGADRHFLLVQIPTIRRIDRMAAEAAPAGKCAAGGSSETLDLAFRNLSHGCKGRA